MLKGYHPADRLRSPPTGARRPLTKTQGTKSHHPASSVPAAVKLRAHGHVYYNDLT